MPTQLPSSLCDKTLELLKNRPREVTFKDLAIAIGTSEAWLTMFNNGKIKNPGVKTIQALYEYLSNSKLNV